MAYLRYKELTKYFYFYKSLDVGTLPKYVTDYVEEKDKIEYGFATRKDKGIFTTKKIVLFDIAGFMKGKKIITIPYKSISTMSIVFRKTSAVMNIYVDSGYPITLKFRSLSSQDKTRLRLLYTMINDIIANNSNT